MNSRGHLVCSFVKSLLRIFGCIVLSVFIKDDIQLGLEMFVAFFILAEALGILEELLDMRG